MAAAAEIIDRDGGESITMRALAAELGVGTMTLYGYFRDKDELLDAIIDLRAAELPLPPTEGPWRDRTTSIVRELRGLLQRHPFGVRVRLVRPLGSPGAMRVGDAAMKALRDAGLEPHEALYAWRTLFNFAFAAVAFQSGHASEAERHAMHALDGAAPAPGTAAEERLAAAVADSQFEYGLTVLLDGIEARLTAA